MTIPHEIVQLITGSIGSFCFCMLFNLRKWRLFVSALGGLCSWSLFLLLETFIESRPVNYFLVAAVISFYAEIMARILKTPSTPIITAALVPLILEAHYIIPWHTPLKVTGYYSGKRLYTH